MDIKNILLLAAGGFVLYKAMSENGFGAVFGQTTDNVSTNPAGTNTNGQSTVVTTPPVNPRAITINNNGMSFKNWLLHGKKVLQIVDDKLTYDQWAFIFKEVYNVPAPPIEDSTVPGANRNLPLTVDQWIAVAPIIVREIPQGVSQSIGGINTVARPSFNEMCSIRNVN